MGRRRRGVRSIWLNKTNVIPVIVCLFNPFLLQAREDGVHLPANQFYHRLVSEKFPTFSEEAVIDPVEKWLFFFVRHLA